MLVPEAPGRCTALRLQAHPLAPHVQVQERAAGRGEGPTQGPPQLPLARTRTRPLPDGLFPTHSFLHFPTARNFNLEKAEAMLRKVGPTASAGHLGRGFVGGHARFRPLLPLPGCWEPDHCFPFQHMEFRKAMDIDHILDWQPPEVSWHLPSHPSLSQTYCEAALGVTGDVSEGREPEEPVEPPGPRGTSPGGL